MNESNDLPTTESQNGTVERFTDEQIDTPKKGKKSKKNDQLEQRVTRLEAQVQGILESNQILLDTIGELQTPAVAQAKAARTGGGSTAPRLGQGVLGYSSTSILRWMGHNNWTNKECYGVLHSFGMNVSPATIQTQRQCGRKGVGAVPTLTEEQVAELNKRKLMVGATATPTVPFDAPVQGGVVSDEPPTTIESPVK